MMMVMQYLIGPAQKEATLNSPPAHKIFAQTFRAIKKRLSKQQAKTLHHQIHSKTICDRTAVLGLDLSKVAIVLKSLQVINLLPNN
jgi:uncharacterized protein (DUF2267 family)